VPELANPNGLNFDEASSDLIRGLKSCRAVVSGYRALIVGASNNDNVEPAPPMTSDDSAESVGDF
jgi:hypothetical protein